MTATILSMIYIRVHIYLCRCARLLYILSPNCCSSSMVLHCFGISITVCGKRVNLPLSDFEPLPISFDNVHYCAHGCAVNADGDCLHRHSLQFIHFGSLPCMYHLARRPTLLLFVYLLLSAIICRRSVFLRSLQKWYYVGRPRRLFCNETKCSQLTYELKLNRTESKSEWKGTTAEQRNKIDENREGTNYFSKPISIGSKYLWMFIRPFARIVKETMQTHRQNAPFVSSHLNQSSPNKFIVRLIIYFYPIFFGNGSSRPILISLVARRNAMSSQNFGRWQSGASLLNIGGSRQR